MAPLITKTLAAVVACGLLPGAGAVRPEVSMAAEQASQLTASKQAVAGYPAPAPPETTAETTAEPAAEPAEPAPEPAAEPEEPEAAPEEPEPEVGTKPVTDGAGKYTYCRQIFEGKDAKDNIVLGTDENMDPRLKDIGLDFTGLWWMRHNPVAEVLATFAGARINSTSFPLLLEIPSGLPNHWSWRTGFVGTGLMQFYSIGGTANPFIGFDMLSKDKGFVDTALKTNPIVLVEEWGFDRVTEDEWNRTTTFQKRSPIRPITGGDNHYMLTRILKEDGSPTKFWEDYLKDADGKHRQQMFTASCGNGLAIPGRPGEGSHRVLSAMGTCILLLLCCCIPLCCCIARRGKKDEEGPAAEEPAAEEVEG